MKRLLFILPVILTLPAAADVPPPPPKKKTPPAETAPAPAVAPPEADSAKLHGRWSITAIGENGHMATDEEFKEVAGEMHIEINAEWITLVKAEGGDERLGWKIVPGHTPGWIDLTIDRGDETVKSEGIYELRDDVLKLCFDDHPKAGAPRSSAFKTEKGTANNFLIVMKRDASAPAPAADCCGTPAAAVKEMLKLSEAGKWEELIKTMADPDEVKEWTKSGELKNMAKEFGEENGAKLLTALRRIQSKEPTYSDDGNTAAWKLDEPVADEEELTLVRRNGRWYIED